MPPHHFESEVESFLEGSHGDRTHIKRADHHTVTPLCGTLLVRDVIDAAVSVQDYRDLVADRPREIQGRGRGRLIRSALRGGRQVPSCISK